jgi:hypothetical protein
MSLGVKHYLKEWNNNIAFKVLIVWIYLTTIY